MDKKHIGTFLISLCAALFSIAFLSCNDNSNDCVRSELSESESFETSKSGEEMDISNQNLQYELADDGTYWVIGGNNCEDELIIPAFYNDIPVTYIAARAFLGEQCESVEIGENVKEIGMSAFCGCTSLTNVTIGENVKEIGAFAFENCKNLIDLEIPESVISIGSDAFRDCTSLTNVTIGENVTTIGGDAFYWCTDLVNVYFKGTIKDWCGINWVGAFSNPMYTAENLYINNELISGELIIPDGTTRINSYAFSGVKQITDISLPNSITYIGRDVFGETAYYNNPENWENGILYIGQYLIRAKDLSGIYKIKEGTVLLAEHSFAWSTNLTEVQFPKSLLFISDTAFYSCGQLEKVNFNNSAPSMGNLVFSMSSRLTSFIVPNENEKYKAVDGNLYSKDGRVLVQYAVGKEESTFAIPEGVTDIGRDAFYKSNLTQIVVPNSVVAIGERAFCNCSKLTEIVIPISVETMGYDAFFNCIYTRVYCEAKEKPNGWDNNWDGLGIYDVVWDYN